MKKIKSTFLLLISILTIGFSQNIAATFRGTVQDAANGMPLVGATIHIFNIGESSGGATDVDGNFRIPNMPVGRYEVIISYLGYENLRLTEVLLASGKEKVVEIYLQEKVADLTEVVVKSTSPNAQISPLSNYEITIEEVQRFPATFFDPARLAMLYPGVTGTNDQANGLSIRGLPPGLLQWRLEGIEIVNPNHLANAGTFSDQPSMAAGGVNILSAQMLDNSRLFTGAFPVEYSNALGGVMDMSLRKGNNQQHEYTAQAGLLGFDFSMEGPFSEKRKASFLFNYRYSFTGLLTNFGVDFDGEEISFEDVSFNLNLPAQKAGNFTIFGIGGRSNNFKAALPEEEVMEFRDRLDIEYTSETGMLGLTHQKTIGKNTIWKTAVAYSQANTAYDRSFMGDAMIIYHNVKKISAQTKAVSKLNNFLTLKNGINFQHNIFIDSTANSSIEKHRTRTYQLTPFVDLSLFSNKKISFNIGLNANIFFVNRYFRFFEEEDSIKGDDFSLDSRNSIIYKINKQHQIGLYAGFLSKIFNLEHFFNIKNSRFNDSANFEFSKAFFKSLKYETTAIPKMKLSAEIYFQTIRNIPQLAAASSSNISMINLDDINFYVAPHDINSYDSQSRNYGIEIMLQRHFTENWYFLFAGSIFDSEVKFEDEAYQNARFNSNWAANCTIGKEFVKQKLTKTNIFGIHLRAVHRGGFWERPFEEIDGDFFYSSDYFTERLRPYFRIDLRCYWKWNKPNKTTTLSLDIQNATNRKNIAYNYDDVSARGFQTQYQLGLIPLLNYRIEF